MVARSDERTVEVRERATAVLRAMLQQPEAAFHDGQFEAIHGLVAARQRLLVVQRTGWGKSIIYFTAAKFLREEGAGPTLIVSPLLALMRNQIEMAQRGGVRALTINSSNADDWDAVERELRADRCDVLLVSPERLANERFRAATLPAIPRGLGMLVIDEAHCISDWGHDFRPDYRRITQIVRYLPTNVPVLATTATANDRVVRDVAGQLGGDVAVLRGPLARSTLRLQTIKLARQAERLAWLAAHLPELPGSGIVYCLTVPDCIRVARWLQANGVDAVAYYGEAPTEERIELERALIENRVKALVATVALGMGFDKPDLGFVVHFQRPGSLVAYYQQIGRAGRGGADAYAILLSGAEDDEIQEYFIQSAFPTEREMSAVVSAIEDADGLTEAELLQRVNLAKGRVANCIKALTIDGVIVRNGQRYYRTANPWTPDFERARSVTATRYRELERIRAFVDSPTCLMEFVARELDDPTAQPCGRCAVCQGAPLVSPGVDVATVHAAVAFLRRDQQTIEPRKRLPIGMVPAFRRIAPDMRNTVIPDYLQNEPGIALSIYGDAGWGRVVKAEKYGQRRFGDELVAAMAEAVVQHLSTDVPLEWVTAVPSLREPVLVPDFARRLAERLGLPYRDALEKVADAPEQKSMQNSEQQVRNVIGAFRVRPEFVTPGAVLLVDDVVDSRWTLAVCGLLLRQAGSGPVVPATLACMVGAGDS